MCNFFSFITFNRKKYYFNAEQRASLSEDEKPDSHSYICTYYDLPEDKCNKYEFVNNRFVIDQINDKEDSEQAERFMLKFKETESFKNICLVAVKQNGWAIQYIANPNEEIKKLAVKQNGYTIRYIDNPSEAVKKLAVKQNGYAIRYISSPSLAVQNLAYEGKNV